MRISQLSLAADVPVATIKYYLREGLVPPGRPTAPNQAEYSDEHLYRLRLIRVLREVGGLSIAQVAEVVRAIDDESMTVHDMLGVAYYALGTPPDRDEIPPEVAAARREVDDLVAGLGWNVGASAPARRDLAEALAALRRLGRDVGSDAFLPYAEEVLRTARREVESITPATRAEAVENMVLGTVVYEQVVTALRRLALEHVSSERS